MHVRERQGGHPSNRRQPPAGRTSVTQLWALSRLGRHDRADKQGGVPPPVTNGTKAEKRLTAMAGEGPLTTSHPPPGASRGGRSSSRLRPCPNMC